MASVTRFKVEHPRDLLNLILAALLFISPWVLGFAGETFAARTAWVTAVVIAVASVLALFVKSATWPDAAGLLLGIWTVAAPWILGFAKVTFTTWAFLAVGILLAIVAVWEVWTDIFPEPAAT